jgi:hypothetical protein
MYRKKRHHHKYYLCCYKMRKYVEGQEHDPIRGQAALLR